MTNIDETNLENFYPSSLTSQASTTDNNKVPFVADIDAITIPENKYHYLCPECNKFPLIDFCKDIKYIKYTCSCFNDKERVIKELIDEINTNSNLLSNSFISTNENDEKKDNYKNGLSCSIHNKKFESFCKTCLKNICEQCQCKEHEYHEIEDIQTINYDEMDILIKKIKEKNINNNEIISSEKKNNKNN